MTIKATDINRAIEAKYSGDEWRVWFEVSQSTGYRSGRRADAVVMNIWPSKDYQLHVFEVKISRADFKNEMADLSKWKAVGKYSDFFWLACPAGLVSVEETPEEWGLMELTKNGLRVKKQAPLRKSPEPLDRAFSASLLRSGADLTQQEIQSRVDEGIAAKLNSVRDSEKRKHESERTNLNLKLQKMERWKEEFESIYHIEPNVYSLPPDMAARMKIAEKLEHKDFERIAKQMQRLSDLIGEIKPQSQKENDDV